MVKVTIDDVQIEVEEGTTILNAARKIGGEVVPPAMCYYSKLPGTGGKCRTCLVEVAAGSDTPKSVQTKNPVDDSDIGVVRTKDIPTDTTRAPARGELEEVSPCWEAEDYPDNW